MNHSLLIALALAACAPPIFTTLPSSRTRLGPQRSEADLHRPVPTAALELTQLFAQRGFMLVDQEPTASGGLVLRLKGNRNVVTGTESKHDTHSTQYGSAFYLFIEPRGEGVAHVSLIGRATEDGYEVCTADSGYELGPCNRGLSTSAYGDTYWGELDGHAEAEIVHGVFSELRLQGIAPPLDPAVEQADRRTAEHARCLERRQEVFDAARRIDDAKARANVLRTLPTCDS